MQAITGSPKEILRTIKFIFYILFTGVILFTAVVFIVVQVQGPALQDKEMYRNLFLLAIFVSAAGLVFSNVLYKKKMKAVSLNLPLLKKLDIYRAALMSYTSLCEAASIFTLIVFFMTGEYRVLFIIGFILAAMLMRRPENYKIFNELQLDSKDQMELT